jgi:hypothetical protein
LDSRLDAFSKARGTLAAEMLRGAQSIVPAEVARYYTAAIVLPSRDSPVMRWRCLPHAPAIALLLIIQQPHLTILLYEA